MSDRSETTYITRTIMIAGKEFSEYMTKKAGGWSTKEGDAHAFTRKDAELMVNELKSGADKDNFIFNTI